MVAIDELTKRFPDVTAVDKVSLRIPPGALFGLLGPNGAGKTTLIRMLCGLIPSGEGRIRIKEMSVAKEPRRIKALIGVVPQELAIYEDLSAFENVRFFGGLYGLKGKSLKERVEWALDFTGLSEVSRKLPRTFSGGMKRRLNIACGIVHQPELIIMDEPTVGIDPQSRNHILKSIKDLNRDGSTIVYTSHYMEEVERLCDGIAIMDHGKIIAQGTREELQGLVKGRNQYDLMIREDAPLDREGLLRVQGVREVHREGGRIRIENDAGVRNLGSVVDFFTRNNIPIINLKTDAPNLEEVFLALTGRSLRDQV